MNPTFKQFLLNETMTIRSMTSPKLKLTRQIKAYFPKDDLDEIYAWMKNAEKLTVDAYAKWREKGLKESKVSGKKVTTRISNMLKQALETNGRSTKRLPKFVEHFISDKTPEELENASMSDMYEFLDEIGQTDTDDGDRMGGGMWREGFIRESLEDDIDTTQKRIALLKKEIGTPAEGRGSRAALQQHQQDLKDLKARHKKESGQGHYASVIVPEEKSQQIWKELHGMWKKKPHQKTPWQSLHGEKEGTVEWRFHDYDPRQEINGVKIEDLIAHVKKYEV